MSKSNKFSLLTSELNKNSKLIINQNECKFLKLTPNIPIILKFKTELSVQIVKHDDKKIVFKIFILKFKTKLSFQIYKQVDKKIVFKIFIMKNNLMLKSIRLSLNIIFVSVSLYVHPMFLASRWIGKLPGSCASAPTTQTIYQGIFSSPHTLCTRENSVNTHVLHSPGTSSVTVQTKTSLKSHLSISETLSDPVQLYIKFKSIFSSTYIETYKTRRQFNLKACKIFIAELITCVFFKPPHLLIKKLYAFIHFTITIFTKKVKYHKSFKILMYTYIQTLFINHVFIPFSSEKFSLPRLASINPVITNAVLITSSNDGI